MSWTPEHLERLKKLEERLAKEDRKAIALDDIETLKIRLNEVIEHLRNHHNAKHLVKIEE